jgi:hypothetical protein
MNNLSKPWQPPTSPSGAISIQDLVQIYAFFNSITEPSDAVKQIKAKMELVFLNFASSLGATIQ